MSQILPLKKMGWFETSYSLHFLRNKKETSPHTLRIWNLEGVRLLRWRFPQLWSFLVEVEVGCSWEKHATNVILPPGKKNIIKKKRCETNGKRGKCHNISILYHMGEHFWSFDLTLTIYMLRLTIFNPAHPNQTTKWGWCFWSYTKIRIWKLEW